MTIDTSRGIANDGRLQQLEAEVVALREEGRLAHYRGVIASALADAFTPTAAAETVLKIAIEATGADRGIVLVRSTDSEEAELLGSVNYPAEVTRPRRRLPLSAPFPLLPTILTGEAEYLESAAECLERYPGLLDTTPQTGTQAIASVPMIADGEVLGAFGVAYGSPRAFPEAERRFLLAAGLECGRALKRARLEEELRAERERLTGVLEQMPAGVIISDATGRILKGNAQMEELFGHPIKYSRDTSEYGEWAGLHPDGRPIRAEEWPLSRSLKTGEAIRGEEVHLAWPDGSRRVLSVNSAPIRNQSGQVVAGVVIDHDITPLRSALDRLHRLQDLTASLGSSETPSDVVNAVLDAGLPSLGVQAGMIALLTNDGEKLEIAGWRGFPDELVRPWLSFPLASNVPICHVVRERKFLFLPTLEERITRFPERASERALVGPGGIGAAPLLLDDRVLGGLGFSWPDGKPFTDADRDFILALAGACAQALDRARLLQAEREAREHLEEKVHERTRQLEERNAEQESFLYTVSHDLRAPLLSIAGMTSLLTEAAEQGALEEVRLFSGRVTANVVHMQRLIDDLLAVSRAGRAMEGPQLLDLIDIAAQVVVELDDVLRECGGSVTLPAPGAAVLFPPSELYQVLSNLVGNAIKFASAAGVKPRVAVSAEAGSEHVTLRVSDNGPGIPARFRDRVFGLFSRLDPTVEGTGVGLAIVKRIVERHGGSVSIEESEFGGACFALTLPAANPPRQEA